MSNIYNIYVRIMGTQRLKNVTIFITKLYTDI